MIVQHFHSGVFDRLPKLHQLTLKAVMDPVAPKPQEELIQMSNLVLCLRAYEVVAPVLSSALHERMSETIPYLGLLLSNGYAAIRHLASRVIAQLSVPLTMDVMTYVIRKVVPGFDSYIVQERSGAIECLACVIERLEIDVIPYIVLLIVPVLGRMSDQHEDTRLLATNTFATLIKLIPLEGSVQEPPGLPLDIQAQKARQQSFMDQLMNVKNVEDYPMPLEIRAELRSYQRDGINWLAFLNRYKLHGILCDDMGLGKTLQTIAILASDHFRMIKETGSNPISLVICPPTLCLHWHSEILKFVPNAVEVLNPIVYSGNLGTRIHLRKFLPDHNLIISSYDVIRNDLDYFVDRHWNYLILDEGHVIKNGKTKTTIAIKQLKSLHRLILSGTPIQNSVLELWSLFDFLMPGFLGTEKQFSQRFSRPIIASRDSKSSSKDQEAGALAMEALHRQVGSGSARSESGFFFHI